MNNPVRARAAQLFDALSHPTRLRIVELLCGGGRSVSEIGEALDLGQSSTSQNLAILTRAGVLQVEPSGTSRIYRITGPRIASILNLIEEFCTVNALYGVAEEQPPQPAESP